VELSKKGEMKKMVKSVALYGTFKKKVPMKQRYWKWVYHRKGSKAGIKDVSGNIRREDTRQ